MSQLWERVEGDALRRAIIKRAADGARARLREMGQATHDPEPEPVPIEPEAPRPTASELDDLLETDDERQWRQGVNDILKAFGENHRRLISRQRDTHIVICRTAVAQYLRNRGWSFPRIGQFMRRDHSSIVHLLDPNTRHQRYVKVQELNRVAAMEAK
jgi:hypothetical protein